MKQSLRLFAAVLALATPSAHAQSYPNHNLRLVVPFGPGGSADAIARPLADKLGQVLGQTVIVDNRPGGLTVIAADLVAKSPPDGYTLYLMPGTHVLTPLLVKNVPYDPVQDYTMIAMLGAQPYIVVANPRQPFTTFAEMLALAKAKPGEVSIGTSDSVTQVIASTLQAVANVQLNMIAYKGGGPQNNDLLGNQIAMAVVTPNLLPFIRDGRVRPLAVTTPQRLPWLPDVPTIAEVVAGSRFDVQTWYAIAGPANLPKPIAAQLNGAINKVQAEPDMKKRMGDLGLVPPADSRIESIVPEMKSYQVRMGGLVKAAGLTPE